MMMDDTTREALLNKAIATLGEDAVAIIRVFIAENKALKQQNEELTQTNTVLRLKVDAMARKLFGKSSEKLDPTQLQMEFDALQAGPQSEPPKPDATASDTSDSVADATPTKRKKRSLEDLIEALPVTQIIIDPEEVKAQPEAWTCIGEEVTKLIDYIPGKFQSEHIVRRKYVCNEARHLPPITAPLHTLQARCIATPRLLAHTIAQRFEQHLPFYRIEQQYERLGVPIPRQPRPGGRAETDCGEGAARRARRAGASESNSLRLGRHGTRRLHPSH